MISASSQYQDSSGKSSVKDSSNTNVGQTGDGRSEWDHLLRMPHNSSSLDLDGGRFGHEEKWMDLLTLYVENKGVLRITAKFLAWATTSAIVPFIERRKMGGEINMKKESCW